MNWFRAAGAWSAMLLCLAADAGCAYAAGGEEEPRKVETVVIPLNQIWAVQMPGTRDILSLDLERLPQPIGTLLSGPLSFLPASQRKIAGPGFAVLGTGMKALLAAHAKLPEGQKPRDTFPFGSELSVVFFSHGFGSYVHVHRVERRGNVITIRYRFVPHETTNMSSHFALIPIGKLSVGKVRVEIIRSPMEKQYVNEDPKSLSAEWGRRVVCKSFSFTISER